jgi:hypothetical protein
MMALARLPRLHGRQLRLAAVVLGVIRQDHVSVGLPQLRR